MVDNSGDTPACEHCILSFEGHLAIDGLTLGKQKVAIAEIRAEQVKEQQWCECYL